jgi:hypothetical protein
LLKRYLDQPGNQVAELIEPAIIASVRNGAAASALRIPEMAPLLTAAIWIAGDERPVRASRPDTLDEVPTFPDSDSSNRLEEGAGRVILDPRASPDPLEWASHLQSRTRLSSLSLDARVCALVPHFDAGRFLADAIDSLTRQTRPLQAIVVIDDHSPEAPVDIVGQFPGVTLLQSPENSGPFRLVQEVIANTDFDAYLFQDADDWSEPERLEVLLSEAIRTGAEVVGSQGMRLIEREREVVSYEHPNDPGAALEQHPIGNPIHYPSSLISRDLLMRLGGFATGFRFGADTEFIRRAGYVAGLRNVPHRLYNYRTRDDSLTNAPLTGIRSEARRLNWDAQHRRARSNAERSVNGLPPMLLPMSVAAPVCLHHLAGPPLPGITREPWPASSATPGESASPRSIRPARGNRHELEVPPRPIFVIGAPRSGASLMTTALSQHNNIAAVYDAAWMAELSSSLHAIYRSPQKRSPQSGIADIGIDVEEFAAQFGAAVNALVLRGPAEGLTVDDPFDDPGPRAPGSGMFAHRWVAGADKLYESAFPLHRLFPHARFIHMLRDPDAVVESLSTDNSRLYRSKFVRLEPDHAYDLWINAVQRCREVEQALGASCIARVDRDALIDDPETVMQTVLDFLREPFEPAVLRPFR